MSKKNKIHNIYLKRIKFILICSIFFLIISTLIFNLNYSSMTIDSSVRVKLVVPSFKTRNILRDSNINLELVANSSNLQEIEKKYNLLELNWNNQSFNFSIERELEEYPTYELEIILKEYSKLNEDIALLILKKLNTQLKILTNEIMVDKYMSLFHRKQIIDGIEALEKSSTEFDKINLMIRKFELSKDGNNSQLEFERFKNVKNLDEFIKSYNIEYEISHISDEAFENKKIISYFDLFLVILTLLIIYLSLDIFLNKFKNKLNPNGG